MLDRYARWVLAKDFVPGYEVELKGLLTNGILQPLEFFDKPDPLDGHFLEETITVASGATCGDKPRREPYQKLPN